MSLSVSKVPEDPIRVFGLRIFSSVRSNASSFLKKSSRKFDKTLRYMWFHVFPHIPITRKVEGSRMGKGKGKLAG